MLTVRGLKRSSTIHTDVIVLLSKTIVLLLTSFILCACGQKGPSISTSIAPEEHAHGGTDSDRGSAMGGGANAVCVTDKALYFVVTPPRDYGVWIWFSDNDSGLAMPLCAKADCDHTGTGCDAYFHGRICCLSAREGKLFWLGRDQVGIFRIYSCNPDGTGRAEYVIENNELLQRITGGLNAFIYGEYAYYFGECSVVKNGEPAMESYLIRCPIKGGAAEIVAYEPYDGAAFAVQAYKDSIFLVCSKPHLIAEHEIGHEIEITQIDCDTLEKKSLYVGTGGFVNNMWVTDDGIFLSCADENKLYYFDFESRKIIVPFTLDPENAYLKQLDFGDDRIIATQRSDIFSLLVMDFEGDVILQKSYALDISQKMKEWFMYFGNVKAMDEHSLYVFFQEMSRDKNPRFLRFPLDGSEPQVLWSEQ